MSLDGLQAKIAKPTMAALARTPAIRPTSAPFFTSGPRPRPLPAQAQLMHGSRARRLDAADQLVELRRGIANVLGQAADDIERLLGLPDFDQLADEILVRL